ncbi:MAG: hypothetical protein JNL67_15385 [Planctomycetaceae bacterium]|nr:hypothetical protein [Planctomycetaceae bacterium]
MSDTPRVSDSNPLHTAVTHSMVCGGCNCWCDDIDWDARRPNEFGKACSLGKHYFQSSLTRSEKTSSTKDEWIAELATALQRARRPLLTGLHLSFLETQRLAAAVADRCGAVIDPFMSATARAKTVAFQQSGEITASWGEVKNRADLVIYWRCRPEQAPRFRERYGDLADGEFVRSADRQVIVVDSNPDFKDTWQHQGTDNLQFVRVDEDDRITLQALVEASRPGTAGPQSTSSAGDPSPPPNWWPIHAALSRAKYAAIVVGELQTEQSSTAWLSRVPLFQLLQLWATNWNHQRRCVSVPFPGTTHLGRVAQSVLTWRTGYPMSVDFSVGYPRYDVVANSWSELIERREVDFILFFSGDSTLCSAQDAWANEYQRLTKWAEQHPLWEIGTVPRIGTARRFISTLAASTEPQARPRTVGRPDGVLLPYPKLPPAIDNREPEVMERLWSMLNPATAADQQ